MSHVYARVEGSLDFPKWLSSLELMWYDANMRRNTKAKKDLLAGMVVSSHENFVSKRRGKGAKPLTGLGKEYFKDGLDDEDWLEFKNRSKTLGYRPEFANITRRLLKFGLTKYEIARDFGVDSIVLLKWAADHPDFADALTVDTDSAVDRVEAALIEKAVGYKWKEQVKSKKIDEDGNEIEEVTFIEKQLPPDNSAMFFLLKNRRSHKWKDKHEVTFNHNVTMVSTNELQQMLAQYTIEGELSSPGQEEKELLPAPKES